MPVNPLIGVTVTVVTGTLVVVCATSKELGETEREKLGGGGGLEPPPPQPAMRKREKPKL